MAKPLARKATPQPPAALDSAGTTFLSYNVPEPITYNGRNFIDLPFPAEYFKDNFSPTRWVPLPVPAPGKSSPDLDAAVTAYHRAMERGFFDDNPPLIAGVETDRYFPALGVAPRDVEHPRLLHRRERAGFRERAGQRGGGQEEPGREPRVARRGRGREQLGCRQGGSQRRLQGEHEFGP